MLKSVFSRLAGNRNDSSHEHTAIEAEAFIPPATYIQCRNKDEKLAWIESDIGQKVLSQRPVLLEYYRTGYLQRILDNPHWKVRLEEWLTLPTTSTTAEGAEKVPYGLSLPKTEEELEKQRNISLHPPLQNPPIPTVFGEYFEQYRSSPKYYMLPLEHRLQILTDGYTILRGVVPLDVVHNADMCIGRHLGKASPEMLQTMGLADGIIGDEKSFGGKKAMGKEKGGTVSTPRPEPKAFEKPRDQFFLTTSSNDLPVLALFYASPIHAITEYLLHGEAMRSAPFRVSTSGGQIAFRFTQQHLVSHAQRTQPLGGRGWHIDGLQRGEYGSFSFLIGFPLNDQQTDFSGNFCLHPGSHYTLQSWLKDYAMQSAALMAAATKDTNNRPSSHDPRALVAQREEELEIQAAKRALERQPHPDLGEPVQVQLSAGDVVIALHKVAHRGGPNYSDQVRKMIYFRVSHREHSRLRYQALDDIWIEYEGLQDLL